MGGGCGRGKLSGNHGRGRWPATPGRRLGPVQRDLLGQVPGRSSHGQWEPWRNLNITPGPLWARRRAGMTQTVSLFPRSLPSPQMGKVRLREETPSRGDCTRTHSLSPIIAEVMRKQMALLRLCLGFGCRDQGLQSVITTHVSTADTPSHHTVSCRPQPVTELIKQEKPGVSAPRSSLSRSLPRGS